jgi:hypothetical protein
VAGLVGADVTEITVLTHQTTDVGVVGLDLGVLRGGVGVGAGPGDGFGYGVTAGPLGMVLV